MPAFSALKIVKRVFRQVKSGNVEKSEPFLQRYTFEVWFLWKKFEISRISEILTFLQGHDYQDFINEKFGIAGIFSQLLNVF